MIWFRRIVAIPLALVFIILFVSLLAVHRVNSTVGNPDFYINQLREADMYNFVYDEIMPAAIDEIEVKDSADFPFDIEQLKSEAPGVIEQALPPEWVEAQVEEFINQVVPYVVGDTDNLMVSIPLKNRVEDTASSLQDTLHGEDIFPDLYEQGIQYAIDQYKDMHDLPSFLVLSDGEVESIIRDVLPPDWILAQLDTALNEIVPYLTKETESFTVKLDVTERMDALKAAVTDILLGPDAYDYMVNELAVPFIQEKIKALELPEEVNFTDREIAAVVEVVLPPGWYEARVNDVADQVFSYLKGSTASIDIMVPLAPLKPAIIESLTDLVDRKAESVYNSLPIGTDEQVSAWLANPAGRLPDYRPADMSYTQAKEQAGIDIRNIVTSSVNEWVPDQFELTDADIREELTGNGEEDILAETRDLVQDGLTYTDADLRKDMAKDLATIEDMRQYMATDYIFTDADLQKLVTDTNDPGAAKTWQDLQDVRSIVGTARTWLWPAWLVPALLLVGIAYLGGRGWKSRVVWGASVLAIACVIVFAVSGPVFSSVAKPKIDEAIDKAFTTDTTGVQAMALDKGVTVAKSAVDSFAGGLSIEAIVLFGVCIIAIAVVVWHPWSRRAKAITETAPPEELPPAEPPPNPPDSPTG